jgi:SAM-dependent methyltransferase
VIDYWDKEWTRRIQDNGSVLMNTTKAEIIVNRLWAMPELIPLLKLEIGCGPAVHIARLQSRCAEWGRQYVGIDPSAVVVETAKKHINAHHMSVFDDALPLMFTEDKVQAVFFFDVLEHIEDHARVAAALKDVVDKEFYVLINVPLYRSELEKNGGFERLVNIQDIGRFLNQLGDLKAMHHEVYGIDGYPYLWVQGGLCA